MSSRYIQAIRDAATERRVLLAILGLAAVVRLAAAALLPDQSASLPDSAAYRNAASELLAGHEISSDLGMPGYPLLLAATGGTRIGQILADVALSVLSVWCVVRMTQVITADAGSGLVAGLIWSIYPSSIFYSVVGLSETLFSTLVLLGFLACYRQSFALGSLAIVAAIMTRPHIEILAPILVVVFSRMAGPPFIKRSVRNLAWFALCYLTLMAPWWWHNFEKYGSFVRLNLGGGLVLYSGNNPMNRTGGGIRDIDFDPEVLSGAEDPVARDKRLTGLAVRYIVDNPRRFVEMAFVKLGRLWRPWPYAAQYASVAPVLVSAASFVPVLLLALVGSFVGWRSHGIALLPIFLFIGYTTAIHMVTIGSVRYRFPMEPFLVVLGAPVAVSVFRRFFVAKGPDHAAEARA